MRQLRNSRGKISTTFSTIFWIIRKSLEASFDRHWATEQRQRMRSSSWYAKLWGMHIFARASMMRTRTKRIHMLRSLPRKIRSSTPISLVVIESSGTSKRSKQPRRIWKTIPGRSVHQTVFVAV